MEYPDFIFLVFSLASSRFGIIVFSISRHSGAHPSGPGVNGLSSSLGRSRIDIGKTSIRMC